MATNRHEILASMIPSDVPPIAELLAEKLSWQFASTDRWVESKTHARGHRSFQDFQRQAITQEVGRLCTPTVIAAGGNLLTDIDLMHFMQRMGTISLLLTDYPTFSLRLANNHIATLSNPTGLSPESLYASRIEQYAKHGFHIVNITPSDTFRTVSQRIYEQIQR